MGVDADIDITTEDRKTVLALLRRHLPGTAAWAYGSRVKWTSTPKSDLDLVVFATPAQRRQVGDLREAFEESNLPFRVDLFVWEEVPVEFRERIEAEHAALAAGVRQPLAEPCRSTTDERLDATIDVIAASSSNAIVGGPFGSNLVSRDYVPQGVPVIRGQNMGARWVAGDFVFVTQEKADSLSANLTRPDDIVLTQRGTLGQVSIVPSALPCCLLSQSQMKVTVDREIADPLFFYYVLSSGEQQDYVRQNAIQTGVPHTNLGILRSTPVPVPPLKEQRAIAHILGTLDDKIELNRRMNATLEAIARALFKSWFVDFDPVRAKMEGRDTGLPKDIADLFPDRLVDSELGEMPQGWDVSSLDSVVRVTKGRSYRRNELATSDTALVTLKSFTRGGGYRAEGLKAFRGVYKDEQVVQPGDVIVACTDVTQAAEVIGRSAIVGATSSYGTLVASLDVLIARPRSAAPSRTFIYYLTGTEDFVAHTLARTTGTTVLHLSRDAVPSFRFVLPPRGLMERFEHVAGLMRARIQSNASDVKSLSDLRDGLLPKLVSGEVRIHHSEL